MHFQHHMDAHHAHLIKSELEETYLNLIVQSFALSLITVFVPIYLLNLGYSFIESVSFVIFEGIVLSIFTPVSLLFAQKLGLKHIILYRTPLVIIYLLGLFLVESYKIPLLPIALIGGVSSSMYWMSLHSLFAKNSDKMRRGRQASKLVSIPKVASLIGPSIGGLIAVFFGFNVLFISSIVLLCISVVPLFATEDVKPHVGKIKYSGIINSSNWKMFVSFVSIGVLYVSGGVMWPIFVYLNLASVASVGFAATIASIGTIVFTLYTGSLSDRGNRHTMLKLGGFMLAITFFMMIFVSGHVFIYVLSFLSGIFLIVIDVPVIADFYDHANEYLAEYIILRQFGLGTGKIIAFSFLFFFADKFTAEFSLASVASLIFSFL